jgi:metal-responsive CopG/Arc/MetJ family transcriptional regulator
MSTKTFNLSLPITLVEALDKRAKRDYSSRSDYIRKAVVNQMRAEETLENLLNRTNIKGSKLGIKSEQQVYDIIAGK